MKVYSLYLLSILTASLSMHASDGRATDDEEDVTPKRIIRHTNELSRMYLSYGLVTETIKICEVALGLCLNKFGYEVDDPRLVGCYSVLGDAYSQHWDSKNAVRLYRLVFQIQTVKFGEDHPKTLATLEKIKAANAAMKNQGKPKKKSSWVATQALTGLTFLAIVLGAWKLYSSFKVDPRTLEGH